MAVSQRQHLKHMVVPEWVVLRLRKYIESIGGKKEFMRAFNISECYVSLFWNGKRHRPKELHEALGIRLVVQPMVYEPVEEQQ